MFKVGDIVENTFYTGYGKVVGYTDFNVWIELYHRNDMEVTWHDHIKAKGSLETKYHCNLKKGKTYMAIRFEDAIVHKKIKATKLARKMYEDNIFKEKGGYIWVSK